MAVIIFLVTLTFIPETASHLEKNFQKNVIRSFENYKMQTQLDDHEFYDLVVNQLGYTKYKNYNVHRVKKIFHMKLLDK